MQIAVGCAHRRCHDCDDDQCAEEQSSGAKQLREVAFEDDDHDLIEVTRACADVRMGQGFGAVGQALGQVGFSGCNRVRVLLQSIFKNAVCVGLGHWVEHLAAKPDEHHAEQETGSQAKRENDRATPECLG